MCVSIVFVSIRWLYFNFDSWWFHFHQYRRSQTIIIIGIVFCIIDSFISSTFSDLKQRISFCFLSKWCELGISQRLQEIKMLFIFSIFFSSSFQFEHLLSELHSCYFSLAQNFWAKSIYNPCNSLASLQLSHVQRMFTYLQSNRKSLTYICIFIEWTHWTDLSTICM